MYTMLYWHCFSFLLYGKLIFSHIMYPDSCFPVPLLLQVLPHLSSYELTEAEAACTRACKGLHQVVSQSTKEKRTVASIPNLMSLHSEGCTPVSRWTNRNQVQRQASLGVLCLIMSDQGIFLLILSFNIYLFVLF